MFPIGGLIGFLASVKSFQGCHRTESKIWSDDTIYFFSFTFFIGICRRSVPQAYSSRSARSHSLLWPQHSAPQPPRKRISPSTGLIKKPLKGPPQVFPLFPPIIIPLRREKKMSPLFSERGSKSTISSQDGKNRSSRSSCPGASVEVTLRSALSTQSEVQLPCSSKISNYYFF